jgi:Domain of unknown function (DUF6046)
MERYNVPSKKENPLILSTVNKNVSGLVDYAGLKGLRILDAQSSPFVINEGDTMDFPLDKFVSKMGTIVYSNIIFNKIHDANGNIIFDDYRIDDCLLQVSQSKKIVTTEIQGKDGTVKEYIGLDDFQIQITGRITGSYGVYEKELVRTLKKILSLGQPLAVSSWWLQNLDITDIVVKDFSFDQNEGEYSTQYFTITALSDKRFEALILE